MCRIYTYCIGMGILRTRLGHLPRAKRPLMINCMVHEVGASEVDILMPRIVGHRRHKRVAKSRLVKDQSANKHPRHPLCLLRLHRIPIIPHKFTVRSIHQQSIQFTKLNAAHPAVKAMPPSASSSTDESSGEDDLRQ